MMVTGASCLNPVSFKFTDITPEPHSGAGQPQCRGTRMTAYISPVDLGCNPDSQLVATLGHGENYVSWQHSNACSRSLLPRRAISCGQGILGGHTVSQDDSSSRPDEEFESAELALHHGNATSIPPAAPLPPTAAAGLASSGPACNKQSHAAAAFAAALLLPVGGYASENRAALMCPAAYGFAAGGGLQPFAPALPAPFRSASPATAAVPGIAAALAAARTPFSVEGEDEIPDLLRPCGNPGLPLEAGWPLRSSPGGAAGARFGGGRAEINIDSHTSSLPSCASLELDERGSGTTGDPDSLWALSGCGAVGAAAASSSILLSQQRRTPQDTGREKAELERVEQVCFRPPNRHRACESGYTSSAPVHAACVMKRDMATIFLKDASMVAELQTLGGALSAPTVHPGGSNWEGNTVPKCPDLEALRQIPRVVGGGSSEPKEAPSPPSRGGVVLPSQLARGGCLPGGADETPSSCLDGLGRGAGNGACAGPAAGGVCDAGAGSTGTERRSCKAGSTVAGVQAAVTKGSSSSGGSRPVGRRALSTAQPLALHLVLGTAAAPSFSAASGGGCRRVSTSHTSQSGLRRVSDAGERQSTSSNYFGTALVVGVSALLDTIAADVAAPVKQSSRGSAGLVPTPDSAWVQARTRARVLGHKLFGCFTGGRVVSGCEAAVARYG